MLNYTFNILRFNPEKDKKAQFIEYQVPLRESSTVLDGLFYIHKYMDPSLAFRFSCRGSVCGSCAMNINDRHRLACETRVEKLGASIKIRPMGHLTVIKDLVVDMEKFWLHYEKIKPYLISNSLPPFNSPLTKGGHRGVKGRPGGFFDKENIVSPSERKKLDGLIECILCGLCFSSCPVTSLNEDYHGPAALLKLERFLEDIRDEHKERFNTGITAQGAWGCRNVFNCQEVCPKNLSPVRAINRMRFKTIKKFVRR